MAVVGIKRTRVAISIPEATYESVKILADREEMAVSRYVKSLIDREVIKNNLPLYCSLENQSDK